MGRFFPQIRRLSIRMTLYFSVILLSAFIILSTTMGFLYSQKLTTEINLVIKHKFDLAGNMLENSISEIRSLHFSLIDSPKLQELMRQQKYDDKIKLSDIVDMKSEINRLAYNNANLRSIFAISKNLRILDPIYAESPYNQIVEDNTEFDYFLQSQLTGRFSVPSSFPLHMEIPDYSSRNTITYFGHYYDRDTYENLGYIAINITKYSLFNEIERRFFDTFDRTYIVDENDNIVFETMPLSYNDRSILSSEYDQGQVIELDSKPHAIYSLSLSSYPNWKIVGFVDYQQVLAPVINMYRVVLIVSGILMVFVTLISFSISKRITRPISFLSSEMDRVGRGEWPRVEPLNTKDEVSRLVNGFNDMVISLRRLTDKISAEHEEKKKIEIAMIQSQLDLLQSQINPHFIHNTLNSIKYMAKKEGADDLVDLIVSFNALLRTSMSQYNMLTTVLEEVDNLHNYIKIQRHRYDVDFQFYCEISEDAYDMLIPKLILQPLVENALFYGIIPKGEGKIVVSAHIANNRLWVNVWDNGAGIPPDRLSLILSDSLPKVQGYNQMGITNVNERLALNYGASSHLVIQSEVDKGTSVGFSIPLDADPPDKHLHFD